MAGFVGNHECVAVINNFVPKEAVFFYTRKQPLESEPKLPLSLAKPLHSLVSIVRFPPELGLNKMSLFFLQMNMNPVRVALELKKDPTMLENVATICRILELMSDREFKSRDVNETLSLKYHILHYFVKDIKKQVNYACDRGSNESS